MRCGVPAEKKIIKKSVFSRLASQRLNNRDRGGRTYYDKWSVTLEPQQRLELYVIKSDRHVCARIKSFDFFVYCKTP